MKGKCEVIVNFGGSRDLYLPDSTKRYQYAKRDGQIKVTANHTVVTGDVKCG